MIPSHSLRVVESSSINECVKFGVKRREGNLGKGEKVWGTMEKPKEEG